MQHIYQPGRGAFHFVITWRGSVQFEKIPVWVSLVRIWWESKYGVAASLQPGREAFIQPGSGAFILCMLLIHFLPHSTNSTGSPTNPSNLLPAAYSKKGIAKMHILLTAWEGSLCLCMLVLHSVTLHQQQWVTHPHLRFTLGIAFFYLTYIFFHLPLLLPASWHLIASWLFYLVLENLPRPYSSLLLSCSTLVLSFRPATIATSGLLHKPNTWPLARCNKLDKN